MRFGPQDGPQEALIHSSIEDIFFGGARGGGKTYGMLLDFLDHAQTYGANASGVFFRRIAKNLEEVIQEAHRIFPHFGGKWMAASSTYVFRSGAAKGARLKFRHLMNDGDADLYLGHAYTWICFEEMTQWPKPAPIDMLRGTLRSAHGVPCFFRATGNPGGAGHNWVKARYVSPARNGFKVIVDEETGERRMFIPSKLEDNKILMQNDPRYEARLRSIGTPTLVKAWRHGNWDVVAGGYFDDLWNEEKHVLKPFDIPPTWTRRLSFDWGSAKPASLGMWAISDGTQPIPRRGQILPYFPRGSFVRFGEWYTIAKDASGAIKPDVGQRLSNISLGQGIAERCAGINWNGNVADPSIFIEAGGPSIYSQMQEGAKQKGFALIFGAADNSRVAGWLKFRTQLEATLLDDFETPGLWVFDNCTHFIRTVPVLQSDPDKPDDVDTKAEDHAGDEARYAIMSRGVGATVGETDVRR
jgi:hypothetical protein